MIGPAIWAPESIVVRTGIPILMSHPLEEYRKIKAVPAGACGKAERIPRHAIPNHFQVAMVVKGVITFVDDLVAVQIYELHITRLQELDRKSTRLNSSH